MEADRRLEGKAALVTGSSRGIGRAVALAFARAGARVAVHCRANREAAGETLRSLPGGPHGLVAGDLADRETAPRLVEETVRALGGIDLLVNNAGIYEPAPIDRSDLDEWREKWDRTIRTNLTGPADLMYVAVRRMIAAGGGRIVNVSSRGAFRGEPEAPAYGASKAGMNALGQSLARALAPHGVYVMTVAPGWVETDMAASCLEGPGGEAIRSESPMGRVAKPEEIAETVLFLASGVADYLTGCIVDINGASYLRS